MINYTVDDVGQMNDAVAQASLLLDAVENIEEYTNHSLCMDQEAFAMMDRLICKTYETLGQWLSWKRHNIKEDSDGVD